MMAILVALIMWFPFSIPKDTTPKVIFVNENKKVAIVRGSKTSKNIHITKGKEITARVKVRLIIPDIHKEKHGLPEKLVKNQ